MADTYTVKKGDTLWGIAQTYLGSGTKYTLLAQINNISNPSLIYVGQVIKLSSGGTSSSSVTPSTNQSQVTIVHFGLQADTDRTLFVTWSWNRGNTENYEVLWEYDTGNGLWFIGSRSTTEEGQSTYNAPSNAVQAKVKVKPISKTYKVNDTETSYWTANWSTEKTYNFSDNPPITPSVPTVAIDDYKLTAELDNLDVNGDSIEFQVVKDNASVYKSGSAKIITSHASYSCTVTAGSEYKVRCRSVRGSLYSDWTEYSSNVGTKPSASSGITVCRASSETSVYLEWSAVSNGKSYELEYTTKINYFDGSNATTKVSGIEFNHYEQTGLESGQEYFFRVRAVNDNGESAWSGIKSVVVGKKPSAPTTWSSATTVISGEPLNLYWVHNSEDGSSETYGEVEIYIDGVKETHTVKKSTSDEEKDKTSVYSINTSDFVEGVTILWRVRTAGITKAYGDWSVQRTVDIYTPPTLQLEVKNQNGDNIDTLSSFPLYISALPGPNTQTPIGYYLSISSNQTYETIDNVGRTKVVKEGDEVYSKYFDTNQSLLVELSAGNVDLENNIIYTVTCVVSMDSGLTTEATSSFKVVWTDEFYQPNAEIAIDEDSLVAYIRPYCETFPLVYYRVNNRSGEYTTTSDIVDSSTVGTSVENAFTTTGEMVFLSDDKSTYFCIKNSTTGIPVEGVLLSVYRREFDGSFTEIAKDLNNTSNTFVTDPHPSLDYARYRIVAVEKSTGAVSYYDVPGYPVGEKSVIIQWDEEWSSFDATSEEALSEPPWSGSLLKLPYNIDVSDSHSSDVELIEYIGRKHPVSYYGTQLGESSTWNVEIDKKDKETLYGIRRLAIWMGDVYVREPSGSGYWANISVSFSQKHCELTIPITFNIARVEGGV